MERLASVLPECRALTHLDLSNTCINSAGVRHLVSALPACSLLSHLDLSVNSFSSRSLTPCAMSSTDVSYRAKRML
eukprot:2895581-Rhodomonas_salina.6